MESPSRSQANGTQKGSLTFDTPFKEAVNPGLYQDRRGVICAIGIAKTIPVSPFGVAHTPHIRIGACCIPHQLSDRERVQRVLASAIFGRPGFSPDRSGVPLDQ